MNLFEHAQRLEREESKQMTMNEHALKVLAECEEQLRLVSTHPGVGSPLKDSIKTAADRAKAVLVWKESRANGNG